MTEDPKLAAIRLGFAMYQQGYELEALHVYTDPHGAPLFWRIRLRHPRTGEKWIRPMKREGGSYAMSEPVFPHGKPLYRLHELAARPQEPVLLVEGEKCADALARLGLLATTSGAADSVARADWSPLAGREVLIWPDHDAPGQRFAEEAAAKLSALGARPRMLDVAPLHLPAKGDCVDWLAAHPTATAADVWGLLPKAPEPPPVPEPAPAEVSLASLATLSPIEYDKARKAAAKQLGVSVSALDEEVSQLRRQATDSTAAMFPPVVPWSETVEAARLLGELQELVRTFIVCEPETVTATALWIAFTWVIDHVAVAPLAVITAPEKRCGKSQLLSLIGRLARRPLLASNITPAAVFRFIEVHSPTLLIDEADTFLSASEELRGVINSGHTRQSAYVIRTMGDSHEPRQFSTWGAKAISGIGTLADTLMDRAIVLSLRRKLPGENVERLRHADAARFERLTAQLARFAADAGAAISRARPELPAALNDRAQDNWEPLLAIADHAGGEWPELARTAAVKLSERKEEESLSVAVELLNDIREVFDRRGVDQLPSAELLHALVNDESKRWATFHGKGPLTLRQLANRLVGFQIRPVLIRDRTSGDPCRGYKRAHLEDAFARYLPEATDEALRNAAPNPSVTQESLVFEACNAATPGAGGAPGEHPEAEGDGRPPMTG